MGWVTIAVASIAILFTFAGIKRGFIKMVVGIVALVAAIGVSVALMDPVADYIREKTSFSKNIEKDIREYITKQVDEAKKAAMESTGVKNIKDVKNSDFIKEIDKLSIPKEVKDVINEVAQKDYSKIGSEGISKAALAMTDIVTKAFAFVICLAVMLIVTSVLRVALNITSKLPLVNSMNALLGGMLGFAEAALIIFIFFAVITLCIKDQWAQEALEQISKSSFLSGIYKINPLIKML